MFTWLWQLDERWLILSLLVFIGPFQHTSTWSLYLTQETKNEPVIWQASNGCAKVGGLNKTINFPVTAGSGKQQNKQKFGLNYNNH